jgi:hypothetical protein
MEQKGWSVMKEITVVTTCEITTIERFTDEQAAIIEENKDLSTVFIEADFKETLGVDDVKILKNQFFIRDVPDQVAAQ